MEDTSKTGRRSRGIVVLEALDTALGFAERVIVAGSVLLMALLMAGHVVGNLLFGTGIPGTYEITELLIVVMTFVGVAYATRYARHISMSAIYDQLSGTPRKTMLIVISLGTGALMFYFAWLSAQYDLQIFERGRVSSSVKIPLWIVYLALPVGFSLAGIQYLLTVARNLISPGIWRSFREREDYADVPGGMTGANEVRP